MDAGKRSSVTAGLLGIVGTVHCGSQGEAHAAMPPPRPRGALSHHAVRVADGPRLRLQLAPEELAEVPVVVQVFHGGLLHVHPEGPDVQAVDRFPQPGGQLHLVQPPPGPRWPSGLRRGSPMLRPEGRGLESRLCQGLSLAGSRRSDIIGSSLRGRGEDSAT